MFNWYVIHDPASDPMKLVRDSVVLGGKEFRGLNEGRSELEGLTSLDLDFSEI